MSNVSFHFGFCWILKVLFVFLCVFSCESKIKAIENKLKLMESGHDSEKATRGKHPLLAQSERTRTHPYKKSRIYNRGKDGKQIR